MFTNIVRNKADTICHRRTDVGQYLVVLVIQTLCLPLPNLRSRPVLASSLYFLFRSRSLFYVSCFRRNGFTKRNENRAWSQVDPCRSTPTKRRLKKSLSNFSTSSICLMSANYPATTFVGTSFKFKLRKENSPSCVHSLELKSFQIWSVYVIALHKERNKLCNARAEPLHRSSNNRLRSMLVLELKLVVVLVFKAPFRLCTRARTPCEGTKMDVVQTRQSPELLKVFINN